MYVFIYLLQNQCPAFTQIPCCLGMSVGEMENKASGGTGESPSLRADLGEQMQVAGKPVEMGIEGLGRDTVWATIRTNWDWGTFMALKSVKKDQVGGHAEPRAKQEKQRMVLWGDGALRGSGIQHEETLWETGCMVKVPVVRQGKKLHSGVFNQINSKKNFLKLKKGLTIKGERNKQYSDYV